MSGYVQNNTLDNAEQELVMQLTFPRNHKLK